MTLNKFIDELQNNMNGGDVMRDLSTLTKEEIEEFFNALNVGQRKII